MPLHQFQYPEEEKKKERVGARWQIITLDSGFNFKAIASVCHSTAGIPTPHCLISFIALLCYSFYSLDFFGLVCLYVTYIE